MVANAVLVNFSGGETSPRSRGRFDAPWYANSARKLLNFISDIQGPARFRPGFRKVRLTRGGQIARVFTFHVSSVLVYELEFTPLFMRSYRNAELVTTQPTTVTAVTNANPAVVTVVSAGLLANGKEIIITGIVGMLELNGRQVQIANLVGSSFNLVDPVTGANVDSTTWGVYASGGSVNLVSEIATPYVAGDLPNLQFAMSDSVAYLTDGRNAPRKLTVDSGDAFAINTYARTNDPFVVGTVLTITGASQNIQGVLSFAAGSVIDPNVLYTIAGVNGMTQLNGNSYYLQTLITTGGVRARLRVGSPGGAFVDTTGFGAYTNGGTATPAIEAPIGVAFYEGRLGFFGTNQRPDCFFLSRSPDSTTGNSRYDDFTGGANADFACFFQLASVMGTINQILWGQGSTDHLFIGTVGGPSRVSGSGLDIPITPTSINVRQFDFHGCAPAQAAGCQQIFFVQRGGVTVRSIKVINPYLATFDSQDMCLNAEQIAYSPIQRVVLQTGRPDVIWVLRSDGVLGGLSVNITGQEAQALGGWHQHQVGGVNAKVLDLAVQTRATGLDQLWAVRQHMVNGVARCFVEIMADDVIYPDIEEFFSGEANAAADIAAFNGALYRAQEKYIHLDTAMTYDGSIRGTVAAATMTPGVGFGVVGSAVTFTASQSVFTAADVGAEIWRKPDAITGIGGGRAVITAYSSGTSVTATILAVFNSASAIPAGDWYFAVKTIYGLSDLDGAVVAVVTDGAVYSDGGQTADLSYPTVTVANGKITLTDTAAVVHVGLPYAGFVETHNLEVGGRSGPAQAKPRNISELYIRFMNSLGVEYGTDYYHMNHVEHRLSDAVFDRPAPVFSGIRKLNYEDSTSGLDDGTREKRVVIAQRLPLPAVVEFVDVHYDTTDEN